MYLWQIRHIPNLRQTFLSLTIRLGLVLLLAGLIGFVARSAIGQGDEKPATGKTGRAEAGASPSAGQAAATAFVAKVHAELQKHSAVKANVEHTVSIGTQQFRATGRYLSSGSKLRLEYTVKPDQGANGSLVEVCDGKVLWSLMTLGGTKPRVTHRDVQQIKAAIASVKNVPDAELTAELGLGGLSGLLASLERTMTFAAMKQEEVEGRSRTVVQGQWKSAVASRWRRKADDPLPVYIPDAVRLVVDSATLFPERIVYLKKQTEQDKKGYRALVSFQFQNVELDATIDEQEFTFEPPQDVVPEDVTRLFLDRITKSQEGEAAATTKAKSATGTTR